MWYLIYLYMFILGLAISLLVTRWAIGFAVTRGVMDQPGGRKPHGRPVPLLGGCALIGSVAAVLLFHAAVIVAASRWPTARSLLPPFLSGHLQGAISVLPGLGVILLGGVFIFLLGLWDDLNNISPRVKLLGQVFVALLLASSGLRITIFIQNYAFSLAVTVLWIVAIINAFNLLDNMDGLSAGVALIVSAVFWCISALQGHYFIAVLLAVFMGSLLGFLRYNSHPARIFMGDAGSMFVGYFIAALTVLQTFYSPGSASLAVLMPVVILAVPIYDTLSVIVIRISRGESIFKADRRHFSHRLLGLGMSQSGAVLFVYLVTLCTGLAAMLLPRVGWSGGALILIETVLIVSIIAILEHFGGRGTRDD